MDQSTILIIAAVAVVGYWFFQKQGRPGILAELKIAYRNLADARHESIGAKYRAMADAIEEGSSYVARGEKPQGEDYQRIRTGLSEASDFDNLRNAGFLFETGRQSKARNAVFDLWQRIEPRK